MNSTLIIYKNCKIIPEKLFIVEEIGEYLSSLEKMTINNFQYIRHSLELTIKVNLSQTYVDFAIDKSWNYCDITNGTARTIHYFIVDKKQLSEDTIQLFLKMDTINTFRINTDGVSNSSYLNISPKTKILRQHKDRFNFSYLYTSGEELQDITDSCEEMIVDNKKVGVEYTDNTLSIGQCIVVNPFAFNYQTLWQELGTNVLRLVSQDGFFENLKVMILDSEFSVVDYYSTNDLFEEKIKYDSEHNRFRVYNGSQFMECSSGQYIAFYVGTSYNWTGTQYRKIELYAQNENTLAYVEVSDNAIDVLSNMIAYFGDLSIDNVELEPMIDFYTEGFSPTLYGTDIKELKDVIDSKFYIIYKNQNEPSEALENPVDCFLACDRVPLLIANGTTTYDGAWFTNDVFEAIATEDEHKSYMVIPQWLNPDFECRVVDGNGVTQYFNFNGSPNEIAQVIEIHWDSINNKAVAYLRQFQNTATASGGLYTVKSVVSNLNVINYNNFFSAMYGDTINPRYPQTSLGGMVQYPVIDGGLIDRQYFTIIPPIESVDRTNAKLIKIIESPYCPVDIEKGYGNCWKLFPVGVWVDTQDADFGRCVKLGNYNYKFGRTIHFAVSGEENPYYYRAKKLVNPIRISGRIPLDKNIEYETKLHNSDYYYVKFVYDSFSFPFQLEKMSSDYFSNTYFDVSFNFTNTLNSRFMFTFDGYICNGKETNDYNNILCIARNNELPIFNQQYINYLRAGYNYDVKNKTRQEVVSFASATLSLIGSIASFAASSATGGSSAALGIGLAVSAVGQYTSAISNTIQLETNMQMKLDQLKQQASSVYGSDDVDLLNVYTNGYAKLKKYEVSERMKQVLFDLFFFTGYVANYTGIPNLQTRTRFNFLQAELVFDGTFSTNNVPNDILEDIKMKYKNGVTLLHKYNDLIDFSQVYENWEVNIVKEL